MAALERPEPEKQIELETAVVDGKIVFVITDRDEAEALVRMARDRLFMEEAKRRMQRILWIGGFVMGGLVLLSQWWPWIAGIISIFLKDVPHG